VLSIEKLFQSIYELISSAFFDTSVNVMPDRIDTRKVNSIDLQFYAISFLLNSIDLTPSQAKDLVLNSYGMRCNPWCVLLASMWDFRVPSPSGNIVPECTPQSLEELFHLIDYFVARSSIELDRQFVNSIPSNIVEDLLYLFRDVPSLAKVYIHYGSIARFPRNICNLLNLTLLDLKYNKFSGLPESIGNLTKLESLDLSNNQLNSLPESIGNLTKLTSIDLGANQLNSLPESIGNLSQLSALDLRGHQLTVLPDSIGNLSSLTFLNLSDNQITELPVSMGNLDRLNRLFLGSNQLTSLPASIDRLVQLQHLDLDRNKLLELPASVYNLTNLRTLGVSYNYLDTLPDAIGNLSELHGLNLLSNVIGKLPEIIGKLTKLDYLLLGDNNLVDLPKNIEHLVSLTRLRLDNNQFKSLPESICKLVNLIYLSISGNPLQDLSILQNLPNLETVFFLDVELPRRYWIKLSEWKSEWLLDEDNAEIRRGLIAQIGYDRICHDLNALSIDIWREYTLLKIDGIEAIHEDLHAGMPIESKIMVVAREPMLLLKMTCPSTGHIHILRVPPEMKSAEAAITWVNHGIHPDKFAVQT
jgi:leucine-rich repeat protein SHOC2